MQIRFRGPASQARYRKRYDLMGLVLGILKEQRGMRSFWLRGLEEVSVKTALACVAFNHTCIWRMKNTSGQSTTRRTFSSLPPA